MTIDEQIGERLEALQKALGITQTVLAKAAGVKQGFLSHVIKGKKGISAKVLINITYAFKNLNLRWLITGEGEMWTYANYHVSPELDSGTPDTLEESARGEYAAPGNAHETIRRRLDDLERRLRDLENKK